MLEIKSINRTIEVWQNDADEMMYWDEAMEFCAKLGGDWRLPSSDELKLLHSELCLKNIGGFEKEGHYWSSSEFDVDPNISVYRKAWAFIFNDQLQSYALAKRGASTFDVPIKFRVRPVRDVTE